MTTSASRTGGTDLRASRPHNKPIWESRVTFVWETGDGHAELEQVIAALNGRIKSIVVVASSVTGNPTITLTVTDADSAVLYTVGSLADGTIHYKDTGDFQEIPVLGDLTIGIDPTTDPGGSSQTLTVEVILRGD